MEENGSVGTPPAGDAPRPESTWRRRSSRQRRKRRRLDESPKRPRNQDDNTSIIRLRRSNGNLSVASCPTPASSSSLDLFLSMSADAGSSSDVPPPPQPSPSPPSPPPSPPHYTPQTRDEHKSTDDCPICSANTTNMPPKVIATHFRDEHSKEEAVACSDWLRDQSVGVCPYQAYTRQGALYNCPPRNSSRNLYSYIF